MAHFISKHDIDYARSLYGDGTYTLEELAHRFGVSVEVMALAMSPVDSRNIDKINRNKTMEALRKSRFSYTKIAKIYYMTIPGVYLALNPSKSSSGIRKKAVEVLGGKCVRCGFTDIRALQIDHVNGGGQKEHRSIGSMAVYRKIIQKHSMGENIKDYQVLCANCNWIKRWENGETKKRKSS